MNRIVFIASALFGALIVASCALPGASQAADATGAGQAAARYSSWGTPIGVLMADPASRAVLDAHIPQLSGGPQLDVIRASTLRGVQGYGVSILTDKRLNQIDIELASLTPIPPPERGRASGFGCLLIRTRPAGESTEDSGEDIAVRARRPDASRQRAWNL